MKAIRIILFFSLLLVSQITFGQGFSYTFEDPCTFKSKTIYVNNPSGNVFLTYNGQVRSFTPQELQSGAIQDWVNEVKSQNISGPCSGIGLATASQLNQVIAQNSLLIMSIVMGQLSSTDFNQGVSLMDVVGVVKSGGSDEDSEEEKNKKSQTTNSQTDNQSQNGNTQNGEKQEMFQGQMMNVSTASNGTTIHFTQTEKGDVYLVPTKISPAPSSSNSLANSNNNQNGTNNSKSGSSTTDNGNQTTGQSGTGNGTNQQIGGNSNQTGGNTSGGNGNASGGSQQTGEPVNNNPNGYNNTTNNQNNTLSGINTTTGGNTQTNTIGGNNGVNNSTTGGVNQGNGNGITAGGENNNQTGTNQTTNGSSTQTSEGTTDTKKDLSGGGFDLRTNGSVKSKVANAKKGGLILTGDIVGIRSIKLLDKDQVKINMSLTKANTTNTRITGSLINFTTGVKNSSFTFYKGYRYKSLTTIIANTSMVNFQWDLFNTTSVMECYKYKKWTGTLGVNYTVGKIGKSGLNSFTTMGGVMTNFTIKKNWTISPMMVIVYSPYIYYYEGLWYKSGFLALPFLSCDYRVSKKFKFNISFSGVQQINDKTLNVQILLGGKAML